MTDNTIVRQNKRFTPRRRFLLGATATILAAGTYAYLRPNLFTGKQLSQEEKMLRSLVDTIVPKDDFLGALDVGIDTVASAQMQAKPRFKEQMIHLINSISKISLNQHHKDFYTLDVDQREALLNKVLDRSSPPHDRANLNRFRKFVLNNFYLSEQGQASLQYQLPAHYPAYAQ